MELPLVSPLNVTVTVTDNGQPSLSASVSFPWNIAVSIPVNTVRLVAPVEPVSPGTTFPVTVYVNAGATDVLSYLFELTFDSAVVMVASITPVSSLFEAPDYKPWHPSCRWGIVQVCCKQPNVCVGD